MDKNLVLTPNLRVKGRTCGLSSPERLTALSSRHSVDIDHVLGQWVELLQDNCGLRTINKHLRTKQRLGFI